jgi:hypothetical protein
MLPAALRQNCRSPIIISSALSPRAKALARDASHPELVKSGISWPDLEAGQSQPRAEFLGSSAVHPVRLSIPGRADQPFSCNLPATAPRCRHDMPITHAPRRHDLPTLPIRNPRSPIPSPICVACFTTADVFLNAGATYGAPPRTPSGKLVTVCSALCVILRLFWTFYVLTPPCARCY